MGGCTCQTLDYLPVGFKFHPTDEELVGHYLKHKLQGHHHDDDSDSSVINFIPELDLCKVEPWEVPAFSVIKSDEPEWFFFSPLDYKCASSGSKQLNRTTKHGFWKAIGNECDIKTSGTNNVIGTKKTLVFYEGPVPGFKTNWVIHEYHAVTFDDDQRTFVLCHLMNRAEKKAEGGSDDLTSDEGEPSNHIASDYEKEAKEAEGITDVRRIRSELNHNAYFRNENSSRQTPLEFTEEEDKFLNSTSVDWEAVINEERKHAFAKNSTQPESLIQNGYPKELSEMDQAIARNTSSDTDAEVVSAPIQNGYPKEPSEKDQAIAQNTSSKENSETRSHQSSDANREGSFICTEMPSSMESLFPPWVYLVNIFMGMLVLSLVISWNVYKSW